MLRTYHILRPTVLDAGGFYRYMVQAMKLVKAARSIEKVDVTFEVEVLKANVWSEGPLSRQLTLISDAAEEAPYDSWFCLPERIEEDSQQPKVDEFYADKVQTNSSKYDLLVSSCLVALKVLFPEVQIFCNENSPKDWTSALYRYQQVIYPGSHIQVPDGPWGEVRDVYSI